MELRCPYCDEEHNINHIHHHMVENHAGVVETEYDEETEKMRYIIACPICPLKYQHRIKPRYKDPRFLEEYRKEIATVAFDQLLYHLAKEHGEDIGYEMPPEVREMIEQEEAQAKDED